MNWFYIDESILEGDRRQGPVSFEDLQMLHSKQQIHENTLVWHKGLENWITWKEALDAEVASHSEEDERMLRETVEAILKERIEEFQKKTFAGFFVRAGAIIIDWFIIAMLWELGVHLLDWANLIDFNAVVEASNAFIDKYSADPMAANLSNEFMSIPGMTDLFVLWFVIQTLYFVAKLLDEQLSHAAQIVNPQLVCALFNAVAYLKLVIVAIDINSQNAHFTGAVFFCAH